LRQVINEATTKGFCTSEDTSNMTPKSIALLAFLVIRRMEILSSTSYESHKRSASAKYSFRLASLFPGDGALNTLAAQLLVLGRRRCLLVIRTPLLRNISDFDEKNELASAVIL
jgi:hypothetical protein